MSKIGGNFLAVNKDYMNLGLKSIELLLISQIEEFERNEHKCIISNKQFANMFGESESTIKRAIDKLEELEIIKRDTSFIEGNGRANKQRVLSINKHTQWKVHIEPTKDVENTMEGSNINDGRFKSDEWKVHNDPIKDNIKNNIKENILAPLDSADIVEDRWIPKDNISNEIFGSGIHSDVRVIEILKQEHKDYPHESADYLSNMPCFYDSNKKVIREYVEIVLGIK